MTEARRVYRLGQLDLGEINRILDQLGDRLDQMEGYRGTPAFQVAPTSAEEADESSELTTRAQVDATAEWLIEELAASDHTHTQLGDVSMETIKIYCLDDGETIIHGMGDI